MNLRIFISIVFICYGLFLSAQTTNNKIVKNFTTDPALRCSSTGIYVLDLATGKMLLSENSDQLLAPASTLKLLTTAASLEVLGPDYRFVTEMGYAGNIDGISKTLEGNLVVRGGGDPALGSDWFAEQVKREEFLDEWIEAIKNTGIENISGDLVVDISLFDDSSVPGSWAWEDIGNYYGAGPSALTVFDNQVKLFFDSPEKPGEPVTLAGTDPEMPGISWQNELRSSPVNRDLAYIYGSPWSEKRLISGTIPAGKRHFVVKAAMPDPPLFLGNYLKDKLLASGIQITGNVKISMIPQIFKVISTVHSPKLSEIISILNHESVNLFAEHLVLQIAFAKTGKGSRESGLQILHQFWKDNGIRDTFFIEDGSGLSRFDAITVEQLTRILQYMAKSKNGAIFKSTLPEAGKGTLSGFKTTDFPGLSLQCKSGSMDRVRGYSGYLKCNSGREVAFTVLCNNFPGTQTEVGKKMQKLLLEIKKAY